MHPAWYFDVLESASSLPNDAQRNLGFDKCWIFEIFDQLQAILFRHDVLYAFELCNIPNDSKYLQNHLCASWMPFIYQGSVQQPECLADHILVQALVFWYPTMVRRPTWPFFTFNEIVKAVLLRSQSLGLHSLVDSLGAKESRTSHWEGSFTIKDMVIVKAVTGQDMKFLHYLYTKICSKGKFWPSVWLPDITRTQKL